MEVCQLAGHLLGLLLDLGEIQLIASQHVLAGLLLHFLRELVLPVGLAPAGSGYAAPQPSPYTLLTLPTTLRRIIVVGS